MESVVWEASLNVTSFGRSPSFSYCSHLLSSCDTSGLVYTNVQFIICLPFHWLMCLGRRLPRTLSDYCNTYISISAFCIGQDSKFLKYLKACRNNPLSFVPKEFFFFLSVFNKYVSEFLLSQLKPWMAFLLLSLSNPTIWGINPDWQRFLPHTRFGSKHTNTWINSRIKYPAKSKMDMAKKQSKQSQVWRQVNNPPIPIAFAFPPPPSPTSPPPSLKPLAKWCEPDEMRISASTRLETYSWLQKKSSQIKECLMFVRILI